jgi:hypothetical protein
MRRTGLAVGAAVASLMVLVGLRACTSPSSDRAERTTGEQPTDGTVDVPARDPGRRTTVDGVPQGWSRDEAGARAAAISAVRLTGDIARSGFITRTDMIEALATASYGPTLVEQSAAQLDEMAGELDDAGVTPASLLFSELPLTAQVVTADDARARVEVWSVLVVAVPDRGAPRQAWRTVAIDLAWERGDWRIDGWSARAGPTPALGFEAAIASVDELVEVTGWPSTTGGG